MIKILKIKTIAFLSILFLKFSVVSAEVNNCIGGSYEPTLQSIPAGLQVSINAPDALDGSNSYDLSAIHNLDSAISPYFKWCVTVGSLTRKNNSSSEVQWHLPSNWADSNNSVDINLIVGDAQGYEVYITKSYTSAGGVTNNKPSVSFTSSYNPDNSKFSFSYQANDYADRVELYYSYDKLSWNRLKVANVKAQRFDVVIADSNNYSEIYFKAKAINSVSNEFSETSIKKLAFNNIVEPPAVPVMKSMGTPTSKNYVNVYWYEVKNSRREHNADYYEVAINTRNNLASASIVRVAPVTSYTAQNLKDSSRYYFWVRAVNARGQSGWSRSRYVDIDIPNDPEISSLPTLPKNKAVSVNKKPIFQWQGYDQDGDEIEYYVRLGESVNQLNYGSGWLDSDKFDFSSKFSKNLRPNTEYFWQVTYRQKKQSSSHYGGSYPVSPVWSFTTEGTGPDLGVTQAQLLSSVEIDEWLEFDVTIKNNGSEIADNEDIVPYFLKNGQKEPFRAYQVGNMENQLLPGQSEIVRVRLQFNSSLVEHNGVVYDNVPEDGNNIISFEINYSSFDVDLNPSNNAKTLNVPYSFAANPPTIDSFYLVKNNLSVRKGGYRYMLGWGVSFVLDASDNVNISKVIVDYRVSEDEPWLNAKTFSNINEDTFFTNSKGDDTPWYIPEDQANVTQTMQLRARVYNSPTTFSTAVTPTFTVFENSIDVDTLLTDKGEYSVGDTMLVSYSMLSKFDVDSFRIKIVSASSNDTLFEHTLSTNGALNLSDSLRLDIPNDSDFIGTDTYLEIYAIDVNGAYVKKQSLPFVVKQNTVVPKEFSAITDAFTGGYSFPAGSRSQSFNNSIVKTIVGEDALVHLLIKQTAFWIADGQNNASRDFRYYYVTYNPTTNSTSSPKLIYQVQQLNNGNLPDELYEDFTINGSAAIFLSKNSATDVRKKYILQNGTVSNSAVLTGDYHFDQLINLSGNTYLLYRQGSGDTQRLIRKRIFPTVGNSSPVSNIKMTGRVNLNGDKLYIAPYDIETSVDGDLIAIESTIEDRVDPDKYLRGVVNIFDASVEALLIDNNKHLYLRNQDGEIHSLFLMPDSEIDVSSGDRYQKIMAGVYSDEVILVYENTVNKKYSVITFDRNNGAKQVYQIGNKVYKNDDDLNHISLNANKFLVIGNPDGDYTAAAQLITADLSVEKPKIPVVQIDNSPTTIEIGQAVNLNWTLSGDVSDLQHIDIIKVIDGSSTTLSTLSSSVRQYTYNQISTTDSVVTLIVRAVNSLGETSEDSIVLRVVSPVTFYSLSSDKSQVYLGDEINLSWSTDISNGNQSYVGYRKCEDEDWIEVFSTRYQQQRVVMENVLGNCLFKIVAGSQAIQLSSPVNVLGVIYKFKNNSYQPSGNTSYQNGITTFQWRTWFDDVANFDIWVKKAGQSEFHKVGSTTLREFVAYSDFGNIYDWKVSFKNGDKVIESKVVSVNVQSLVSPEILSSTLKQTDMGVSVVLNYKEVAGAINYFVYRSKDSVFEKIGQSSQLTYIDSGVEINSSYKYYIVAVGNGVTSKPTQVVPVSTVYDDSYFVVIDNENYQTIAGNNLLVKYRPDKSVPYEAYEVLLGESLDDLKKIKTLSSRKIALEDLKYATTYYLQIYPLNIRGERLSSTPAKLVFTTGLDTREISQKSIISAKISYENKIQVSWTSVENADQYLVYVDEGGFGYKVLAKVDALEFTHQYGLNLGSTYTYKVKAFNSYTSTISDSSTPLKLVDADSDGDGVVNSVDNCPANKNPGQLDFEGDKLGDVCDADDDNDGLLDEIEYSLGTSPFSSDTDADGLSDYNEIVDISNPADSDKDGKIDAIESSIKDSDGDGIADQFDPTDDRPQDDGDILDFMPAIISGSLKGKSN